MTKSKTEVLFCTDGIFPHAIGGMQRHSRLLVEELAKNDLVKIIVVHPHVGTSVFNNPAIEEIAVINKDKSSVYLLDCFRYSREVYKVIRKFPDAVVYGQGLSVWYKIKSLPNKIIVNPHGLEAYQTITSKDYAKGLPFRTIFNFLFKSADKVISLGGRLTPILEKIAGKKKVEVISNAVNVPDKQKRNFTQNPLRFLFVGRFAFNKGINVLIEAAKQLNEEGYADKFHFDLVGKGPLYEEYLSKYNLPNLTFVGFADDAQLENLYRSDDVFVLPTLFEGMPTVVLEAMANGMPIIVTDVGATKEMVDSSNGYIIEKNDVQSLKKAILHYYNLTPEEKNKLSDNSWTKVAENFSWKMVAEKHYNLFKRLLK